MEQKQKTVLIIFCTLFAFLFINALVGTGMLVVSGNVGGLLGELFGDMDLLPLFEMNSSGPSSEIKLPEEAGTETQAVEDLVTLPPEVMIDTGPSSEPEAYTGSWSDFFDSYFDKNREHRPSKDAISKVSKGMTLVQVIEVMGGKPHDFYDRVDGLWGIVWYTESDYALAVDVELAEGAPLTDPDTWDVSIVKTVYNYIIKKTRQSQLALPFEF